MRGGTFNLRYGRPPDLVRSEVINVLDQENLDFLGVQETNDYYFSLKGIPGYRYWTGGSENGGAHREVGIIVREDHTVSRVSSKSYGDGWPGQGFRMRPRVFLKLVINGRHKVACVHFPPKVDLREESPEDRYDDYVALAKRVERFLSGPSRMTRTVVMDANVHPSNTAKYSPAWIAKQTGATLSAPDDKLDYILTKGAKVVTIKKLNRFPEDSDHNPVVFAFVRFVRKLLK